ncbi:RidA family protein [Rhodococcus wratislaviensis]|uniref:Uncharacterized protein n=1 Tax=Rhodococcus wratislaviensis NBRC 100605 TaxID=1219028 RepID=X0Q9E8_RHOWR|nr:RidA family protein [Rhodococcus wratislaviensis]GAF47526.1 hypothetical protein RW1_041_00740 [Rhodococcus wratislaviensis NBRC 100605]
MITELVHVGNALDFGDLPLSAAARIDGVVHTAGIVPVDPLTGALAGADIETQARSVLSNLATILESSGSSLDRVAVVRIYLSDIEGDLDGFNRVYAEFFPVHHPARYALGVRLARAEWRVEIQAVASCDGLPAER